MRILFQKLQLIKMKLLVKLIMKFKIYEKYSDKGKYANCLMNGPIVFQTLRCGVTLGIFDELDKKGGQTVDELSASLNIHRRPLDICLRTLEYSSLVMKVDNHYYNHPLNTFMFLKKYDDIFTATTTLDYMHHVVEPACSFLEQSVINNEPYGLYNRYGKDANFYAAISKDNNSIKYFDAFMKAVTNRNKDRVTSDSLFSRHHKVLDVGGSTGEIAVSLALHHAALEVTVLDFPDVLQITLKKFDELGMEKRLKTYAGEPLKELPSGYDCILFCHFFDIFSPETNRTLLKNAYHALPSGGAVGIFTPITHKHRNGVPDLWGPYFLCLAEGQGKFYTQEDIVDWIKKENYTNVSVKELPFDEVFITAEKKMSRIGRIC